MKNALEILKKWMYCINTVDVEKLVNLYDKNAVMIPTFSNRLLDNPEKIRAYFEKVGSKKDLSISLHENTVHIQEVGNEIYCISGIYTWCFCIDDEPLTFEARFSYVFDLKKESPILNHHSSQIPRSL